MKSRFLKIRMSANAYDHLKNRAAESGKPISTFAHALLEQENSIANTEIQLDEINSQLQELTVLLAAFKRSSPNDEQMKITLNELLLIVRELALERDAQILSRVSVQIKSQFVGVKHE